MMVMLRRFGIVVAFALVAVYAAVALRGPQGIQALMEKRVEIRALQEENATLARENLRKEDRIKRLKNSPAEQEMEIRKRLKLLRPGETSFILPEPSKPLRDAAPAPSTGPAEPSTAQ
jgi:cell division protein FtsB